MTNHREHDLWFYPEAPGRDLNVAGKGKGLESDVVSRLDLA